MDSTEKAKFPAANKFARVLKEVGAAAPKLTLLEVQVLCEIAAHPEVAMRDVEHTLGITSPEMTRAVKALMLMDRGGSLVENYESTQDRRYKLTRLTYKGRKLMESISSILEAK